MNQTRPIHIGVDGCRAGWFYTAIDGAGTCETGVVPDIACLWNRYANAELILIDIPIGLASSSHRTCDTEARRFLGSPRPSSVFPPPCRNALYATGYEEACEINQEILGKRISKQTWGIAPKIREVDELLQSHPKARDTILESHPEVCFRVLAGKPVVHPKRKLEGVLERSKILSQYLPDVGDILRSALARFKRKEVQPDDILDSMVLAVAATSGKSRLVSLPTQPEIDNTGLPMQIVYPEPSSGSLLNQIDRRFDTQGLISDMISKADSESRTLRATEIYNETWMLRLILGWFSGQPGIKHPLSFSKNAN